MCARRDGCQSFVIVAPRLRSLTSVLTGAFTHSWVASYQVGFGPPLIRSSDRLLRRLQDARSGLEKLSAYLEVCLFDPSERARLAATHRRLFVRRHGPVEAEALAAASVEVLDLSFRLHALHEAPDAVRDQMEQAGLRSEGDDVALAPQDRSARFLVHLFDPRNVRLLHSDAVASLAEDHDEPLAVELRVPVVLSHQWTAFCRDYAGRTGFGFVDLKEPGPHARVTRDGTRR